MSKNTIDEINERNYQEPVRLRAQFEFPNSVKWMADKTLNAYKKSHANENDIDFTKAEGLFSSLFNRDTYDSETLQNPTFALCPNLRNNPYWQPGDSAIFDQLSNDLQENYSTIIEEYQKASIDGPIENLNNAYDGELDPKAWRRFVLSPNMSFGRFNEGAKSKMPLTCKLLEKYGKRIASSAIYAMEPGTELPPHTDSTNFFIVCHQGLIVPDNCGFKVNDKLKEYASEDITFFDQSFTHSAWNKGDFRRINLTIFLVHPDINDKELDLVLDFRQKLKRNLILISPIIITELIARKVKGLFTSK